jgi:hypothetical protein
MGHGGILLILIHRTGGIIRMDTDLDFIIDIGDIGGEVGEVFCLSTWSRNKSRR